MATNSARECSICSEDYNEKERCPRGLPCSHSICSECLQNLIDRNNKICPFCLRQFSANSARDIGVNTALLDVLQLLRDMEQKARSPREGSHESPLNWREEFKKENEEIARNNISSCRQAKEHISITIRNNNKIRHTLSQVNHVIENEIIVNLSEIMSKNRKRMRSLEEQNKQLENQNKALNISEKKMEEAIRKLTEIKTSSKAGSLFDEVECMNSDVKTWLQSSEKQLLELKKFHQKIEKVAKSTENTIKILQEALKSHAKEEEEVPEFIPNFPLMSIQEIMPQDITVETLREKKEPVMEQIRQGKVYAVQLFEGKQRYAKISISRENRICLHQINQKITLTNVHLLQHSDVMNLVTPSSRLTFLELSDANNRILGRMYIRLTPDSKRATQFSYLCTGEKGPTYTNTPIMEVYNKGSKSESVMFQNIDLLKGNGSTALVSGATREEKGAFLRPWVKGSVQGAPSNFPESAVADFIICSQNYPGNKLNCCFGMVEVGLDVLTKAIARQTDVRNVVISDSGIVLPI